MLHCSIKINECVTVIHMFDKQASSVISEHPYTCQSSVHNYWFMNTDKSYYRSPMVFNKISGIIKENLSKVRDDVTSNNLEVL